MGQLMAVYLHSLLPLRYSVMALLSAMNFGFTPVGEARGPRQAPTVRLLGRNTSPPARSGESRKWQGSRRCMVSVAGDKPRLLKITCRLSATNK